MMREQKLLLILDAFRKWFLCDGGQDFPETVLRMSIVEMLFPGLDGGKGSRIKSLESLLYTGENSWESC